MRVLYASFDEVPSWKGASTHILASSRASIRAHEVHLVTLGEVALPRALGLRHHPQTIPEPNLLRRGMAFRARVAELAARLRPDVAHFRSPWEGLALLEAGLPCLYEVNGLASIELAQAYKDVPSSVLAVLRRWEARCLAEARLLVCPSPRIREHLLLRDASLEGKLHVVPNGYDLVEAEPPPPSEVLRLVYLGTLHPWQGLFRILRALVELGDRVQLDVYTQPSSAFRPLLERRLARLGLTERVRLRPPLHRAALAAVLPRYDLGIAPLLKNERNTTQGCDPIKVLDYLAHGLPVVAPDLFVVRQALRHEENGLLYPPDDVVGFGAAIARLHEDRALLGRLRARSRASLSGRPSWDEHARRIEGLYRALSAAA